HCAAATPCSTPITGIADCCARATSGQTAAAAPVMQINSRRLIAPPTPGSGIVAGQTGRLEVVRLALGNVRFGSLADIPARPHPVCFTSESGHPRTDAATVLFSSDDHCPIGSAAILRMRNTDPLRAVQQQIGAMCSGID